MINELVLYYGIRKTRHVFKFRRGGDDKDHSVLYSIRTCWYSENRIRPWGIVFDVICGGVVCFTSVSVGNLLEETSD